MVGSYAQPLLILLVGLDLNSPSLSYLFLQKWVKRDAPYCFFVKLFLDTYTTRTSSTRIFFHNGMCALLCYKFL